MIETLDCRTAADACRVEHRILEHVKNALRVALDWKVPDVGMPRKISSVRFTFKSFQRHLIRLIDIEEYGGYMAAVADFKPNLYHRVEALRCEHDDLRRLLADIVECVKSVSVDDVLQCTEVCDDIAELLARVDKHDRSEITLIQEAFSFDEGGEG